eukprot:scaffold4732_cov344-Prasinococcus_capsulatus_cf.AAC.1
MGVVSLTARVPASLPPASTGTAVLPHAGQPTDGRRGVPMLRSGATRTRRAAAAPTPPPGGGAVGCPASPAPSPHRGPRPSSANRPRGASPARVGEAAPAPAARPSTACLAGRGAGGLGDRCPRGSERTPSSEVG